ncbi:WG repeat-containing protein [Aquimarina sp. M1]
MKKNTFAIIFFFLNVVYAQEFREFKIDVLIAQLPYADNEVKTTFENGLMYYRNTQDNTKLFSKGFDVAYPFFYKNAIIKQDGKYGIIDKTGAFLIEPLYDDFELAPYENESYIVIFNDDVIVNLYNGNTNASYIYCAEVIPTLYAFQGKNKKFGVKKERKTIVRPKYDTILAIGYEFIVASKNKYLGIIDVKGKCLVNFEYEEAQYSEYAEGFSTYPIVGLRKNKTWTYFEKGKEILKSEYKCENFSVLLENAVGVFTTNGKKNVLFKNENIMKKEYDFISNNGLVGRIDNNIFLLKSDGSDELYFSKN